MFIFLDIEENKRELFLLNHSVYSQQLVDADIH